MIIYHDSTVIVKQPAILQRERRVDFGMLSVHRI